MSEDLTYLGPHDLPGSVKGAVINSRQSKFPLGADAWVKATEAAVAGLAQRGLTVITSLGMNTWELVLALAGKHGLNSLIVLPAAGPDLQSVAEDVRRRFRLGSETSGFLFYENGHGASEKTSWPRRDELIAETADLLFPVSVRPGGNLDRLIAGRADKVCSDFGIPYEKSRRPRPRYDASRINPGLIGREILIHFTRSVSGPWPRESDFAYYMTLLGSDQEYCHSARKTLANILESGVVYASGNCIRDGYQVVAFTRWSPEDSAELFRYRPRLVNPYFEPYGIGIDLQAACNLGLRPVQYGLPQGFKLLPGDQKPYFQHRGGGGRWMNEREWRHIGDFQLESLRVDSAMVLVPSSGESDDFAGLTRLPVVPLFAAGDLADEKIADGRVM